MVDDLLGIALFHDKAAVHEDDLICHVPGEGHLVSDDDHGGFLFRQTTDNLQYLAGQLRIQRGGWLVKAENIRVERQCPGDGHPLLLTAGKLMRIVPGTVRKAHLVQQLHSGGTDGFLTLAAVLGHQFPGEGHVFQSRILGKKVEGLEHHAEVEPVFPDLLFGAVCVMVGVKQHLVLYGDGAGVRRFQKVQTPQQRGFAAAGGANDGKGLSLLQREADVIEDLCVFKMLFQMLYG